jgi:hypothetical protein
MIGLVRVSVFIGNRASEGDQKKSKKEYLRLIDSIRSCDENRNSPLIPRRIDKNPIVVFNNRRLRYFWRHSVILN